MPVNTKRAGLGGLFGGLAEGIWKGLATIETQKRTKVLEDEEARRKEEGIASAEANLFDKQIKLIQQRILEKQADNALMKEENEKTKMGLDVIQSMMGEEGIEPNRKDQMVKSFNEKWGIDVEPYFRPNKDEKSGVIKSYNLEDSKSLKTKFEQLTAKLNADTAKLNSIAANVNAQAALSKANAKDNPKDLFELYLKQHPNATWEDALKAQADIESIKQSGLGFELDMDENGRIKGFKFGKGKVKQDEQITPANRTEIEKSLAGLSDQMFGLKEIANTQMKEALTYPGQIKEFALSKLDKVKKEDLSPEDQKFLGQMWTFKSNLGRFFDAYRLEVTKSQAAMKELQLLQNRVLNEDMTKSQFKYAINYTFDRLNRQMRLKRQLLSEGFYGDNLWNKLDEAINKPDDPTLTKENIAKRGDELEKLFRKGNPDSKQQEVEKLVVQQLKKEGYVP